MPEFTIESDDLRQLYKFELKCNTCGSSKCRIEVDWAAYPSSSWCNATVICENCHEDEEFYQSS